VVALLVDLDVHIQAWPELARGPRDACSGQTSNADGVQFRKVDPAQRARIVWAGPNSPRWSAGGSPGRQRSARHFLAHAAEIARSWKN